MIYQYWKLTPVLKFQKAQKTKIVTDIDEFLTEKKHFSLILTERNNTNQIEIVVVHELLKTSSK